MNRNRYGGIFSLGAYIAAGIFFAFETFGHTIGTVPLIAAGLLCLAIAFILERFGL